MACGKVKLNKVLNYTPSVSEKNVVLRPRMVCRIKVVLDQLTMFWTLMPLDSSVTIRAIKSAPSVVAAPRPSRFVAHFASPSSCNMLCRSLSRHEARLGHGGGVGLRGGAGLRRVRGDGALGPRAGIV